MEVDDLVPDTVNTEPLPVDAHPAAEEFLNSLRSDIYVSGRDPRDTFRDVPQFSNGAPTHYKFVLQCAEHYTQEMITQCNERLRCFNCARPIANKIFFYPLEYTTDNYFVCSPLPHCSASCALRSVKDLPNNFDVQSSFFTMYGPDVIVAPPRALLYLPNGPSLEEYHRMCASSRVVQAEQPAVTSFIAPYMVSSTFMKNNQVIPHTLAWIAGMSDERTAQLASTRDEHQNIKVPDTELSTTAISSVFPVYT